MRIATMILALLLCSGPAFPATDAPAPDQATRHEARFEIKEKDGEYRAEARMTLTIDFLTERSTEQVTIPVGEDPHGKVDKMKARLNGEKFDYQVDIRYPQMRDVFLNEARVWLVMAAPAEIKVGDQLVITYRVTYDDLAYLPMFRIPNDDLLTSYMLTFEHPAEVTVTFDTYSAGEALTHTVTRQDPDLTVFHVDSLARRTDLPYFDFNDQHAVVLATLTARDAQLTPRAPMCDSAPGTRPSSTSST